MSDKDKILKAFTQCADALSALDQKGVMKVFQLLSIQYDLVQTPEQQHKADESKFDVSKQLAVAAAASNGGESDEKSAKADKRNGATKAKAAAKEPTHLIDYDFCPPGKESLKDFVTRYQPKNFFEINLVVIYYLQTVIGESPVTVDHVYSAYRHLGKKIPAFPQTLKDTKSNRGWIEAVDVHNLKVVREGLNHLEQTMGKKEHAE